MVKKVFALASVTALSGLMISAVAAGCSSTVTVPDTNTDTGTPVKDGGNGKPDTSEPDSFVPSTCPIPGPIDTSDEPFKTPTPTQAGACTNADLVAMEQAIKKNGNITLDDVIKVASASCQACAYGPSTAATWPPVISGVTIGTQTGTIYSAGACVALASGKDACGKAYAGWSDCLQTACDACASGAGQACGQAAQQAGAACETQTSDLATACGQSVNDYITACQDIYASCTTCGPDANGDMTAVYTFEGPIIAQCIKSPVSGDAGDGG